VHPWHSRGYLPHLDQSGLVQHLTVHLADSLPSHVIARMEAQVALLSEVEQIGARRKRIHEMLDSGLGACVLRQERCARIVVEALHFGDGTRYRLLAWVVMPNHLHVLIEQLTGWTLARVVQGWKRHTTREINRALAGSGQLWQREYWDRFIRDERHYRRVVEYIHDNPVKAGLVAKPQEWPWSSASG